jgi:hypothetical protein
MVTRWPPEFLDHHVLEKPHLLSFLGRQQLDEARAPSPMAGVGLGGLLKLECEL